MRKLWNVLLVLMLVMSVASLVLADKAGNHGKDGQNPHDDDGDQNESVNETDDGDDDDENETGDSDDNETRDELRIMNTSLGAEIRLLQLEKAIIKNILKGEMVIAVLNALNFSTTNLTSLLQELKDLLKEVQAVNASANDSVARFVELKQEARNITTEFRETLRALFDDVTLKEIRERIQNLTSGEIQNYTHRIRALIRQFNWNQAYRLYGIIGEANMSLLSEYLNGNITLDQLRFHLCKTVNQMNRERRYEIFSEIKEEHIRGNIYGQQKWDDLEHPGKGHGHDK